jgi:cholesterol transport system auxiliary component
MIRVRTLLAASLALALAGCISLFPKSEPAQLYRFGASAAPSTGDAAAGPRIGVYKSPTLFNRAVGGDRILGVTGNEAAYIADARWAAPAPVLFDEALAQLFDANTGPARLVGRGEVAKSDLVLKLDVRNFEAVYDQGAAAAPNVVVRVRAVVTRSDNRALVGETVFEAKVRAYDNRVGAIVEAFNDASGQVLAQIVTWTNAAASKA